MASASVPVPTVAEPNESIAEQFRGLFSVDDEKLRLLSHSKRFLERWIADDDFKAAIINETMGLEDAQKLCGCEIDVTSLQPVFHPDYRVYRSDGNPLDWPLTYMWDQHIGRALQIRDAIPGRAGSNGVTPQFDQWRVRNMNRAALQLDIAASGITHPPVAFELSSGCSVGCWFCGISAEAFKGHATLEDGGDVEWRKTVEAVKSIVGNGMQCGFCYWATDPLDNPEYVEFLRIFEDVVGVIPQTTTAIPLRDVDLTKRVLAMWQERKSTPNRFSVMTKRKLLEIHQTFTPEELFGVEMVLQTTSSGAVTKFTAGRNRDRSNKKDRSLEGTIACVTGFLINIVEKTVKLISPTMPSEQWPNGYIIYVSREYRDADHLKEVLDEIVANDLKTNMAGSKALKIAEGGVYDRARNTDAITFRRIEISNEIIGAIGPQLADGKHTPVAIAKGLLKQGVEPIKAIAALEKLWQEGVVGQDA